MKHCWHRNGHHMMSIPPSMGYICCHCGTTHAMRQHVAPGHGRFSPPDAWGNLPDDECSARDAGAQQ